MQATQIFIGADHAGFELKQDLVRFFKQEKIAFQDVGTFSLRPVDYPDVAEAVALQVAEHAGARGILICGSGIGASVAANKIPGVRAGVCHDTYSAHQGVEHDQMNVLVLGAQVVALKLAQELVIHFLGAEFDRASRHLRRVRKIQSLENKYFQVAFARRIA